MGGVRRSSRPPCPWHDGAVLDSQGLPDYPPAHNAWEFPPPPVSARWKWVAITLSVVASFAAMAMTIVAVVVGTDDYPGIIQDPDLIAVIGEECDLMTSTVESISIEGSVRAQAGAIIDQNRAVTIMLDSIRADGGDALDDDRPTRQWLADWQRLVDARTAYAADLTSGAAGDLEVPLDEDGDQIDRRMEDVWIDEPGACDVPSVLVSPYPENDADV